VLWRIFVRACIQRRIAVATIASLETRAVNTATQPKLLTISMATKVVPVCRHTLYRLIKAKKLRAKKVGKLNFINYDSFAELYGLD
jgi:excisionase family DNA binding protein